MKDPRRKQGRRYRLSSIVLVAVAAMLSNHVSELAIAEWGASQSEEVKHALGFHNGITPHQSTIHRLFRRLNEEEVEAAFRCFFRHPLSSEQQERGATAVSIDGKAQRGRLKFEAEGTYPMHAVSVVDHQTGIVLTQGHVEPITPPPKTVWPRPTPRQRKPRQNPQHRASREQKNRRASRQRTKTRRPRQSRK